MPPTAPDPDPVEANAEEPLMSGLACSKDAWPLAGSTEAFGLVTFCAFLGVVTEQLTPCVADFVSSWMSLI
ncbi:hypothetical protein AJ88_23180 [Mesorhizobium amorphae CCBAU 01583]|nr:hypothetical protein AJ88_23180 [Mesorhizobium amorphae CCBAU 01583]